MVKTFLIKYGWKRTSGVPVIEKFDLFFYLFFLFISYTDKKGCAKVMQKTAKIFFWILHNTIVMFYWEFSFKPKFTREMPQK
jgi:hypothetical protein